MSEVQVEQKTYQMPPPEGITIAHFLTVADVEPIASILRKSLRPAAVRHPRQTNRDKILWAHGLI
jgi:hypothetical protein